MSVADHERVNKLLDAFIKLKDECLLRFEKQKGLDNYVIEEAILAIADFQKAEKIKPLGSSTWPQHRLSLDLLSGAMEVGKDLYLLGHFGGFGGTFFEVHRSEAEAVEAAFKIITESAGQKHASVYRVSVNLETEMEQAYEALRSGKSGEG
jgi:hypothetical protein